MRPNNGNCNIQKTPKKKKGEKKKHPLVFGCGTKEVE